MKKEYRHDLRNEAEYKTQGGCIKWVTTSQGILLYVSVDLIVVVVSRIVLIIVIQYRPYLGGCKILCCLYVLFQTLIMVVAFLSAHSFYRIFDVRV